VTARSPPLNAMRTRAYIGKILPLLQGLLLTPAIAIALLALAVQFGPPALAISVVPACAKSGLPDLKCAELAFVNVARIIFSVTGSFALLMFVVGGFKILSSAGNDKKVSEGKEYIKNAIIGIFIILSAAYVIEYGQQRLTGSESCKNGIQYPVVTKDDKGNEKTSYECCVPPTAPGSNGPRGTILFVDGKQMCVANCSQLKTFACLLPSSRGEKGAEGCIEGFTDCSSGKPKPNQELKLCCPK
jgi:hypothetical protein